MPSKKYFVPQRGLSKMSDEEKAALDFKLGDQIIHQRCVPGQMMTAPRKATFIMYLGQYCRIKLEDGKLVQVDPANLRKAE